MNDLAKCAETCNPVLQIRGQMGPGDYIGVVDANGVLDADHYKKVELDDANRDDCRIVCKTCGLATGWGPQNFPNAPGAGADFMRKKWGEVSAAKHTKDEMMAVLRKQFGDEAVAAHFGG